MTALMLIDHEERGESLRKSGKRDLGQFLMSMSQGKT